ncbi:MAG: hypothetical protein KGL39_47035 [Patescibacteria group bacterium]|nr:hypothetical protein [Patescibacteria group bacterium]
MSEHKSGVSNWTVEERKLYRDRRDKGLRGQTGAVTVFDIVKDEEGKDARVPLGDKISSYLSRRKSDGRRAYARHPEPMVVKRQAKASGRGE